MKIIKNGKKCLVLGGCLVEEQNKYRAKDSTLITIYGGGGFLSSNSTSFQVSAPIDKVLEFLESDEKILNAYFSEYYHNE